MSDAPAAPQADLLRGRWTRSTHPLRRRHPDPGQGQRRGHHQGRHLAIGVDLDGREHALGCWIQDTEAAEIWQKVVTDLRNRGVRDILIPCCDGLTGLPDAIRVIFPDTVVRTCVVHVIHNAMRFVSYGDRKTIAKAMREIYTAPNSRGRRTRPSRLRQTIRTTISRRRGCLATRLGQLYPIP